MIIDVHDVILLYLLDSVIDQDSGKLLCSLVFCCKDRRALLTLVRK